MNFIKKKTIHLSISWLLIFSLLSTSILPTFSSLSTNVQAQAVNGYVYQEADFTVRDNSVEIKDIENLLATEKPSWQSPSFTKKSPEYQALTQPELVTEYPEYNLSSGSGGTYLEVTGSSVEVFSPKGVKAQSVTMNWQDSLNAWISSREAPKYEAKAPVPNGYTTSVYVKDKVTGKEYKIRGNQENNNGKNSFTWNGTDINGIALPDGVYEWYIKAAPQTVVFVKTETVADVDEDGNKVFIDIEKDVTETAPGYSPEYSFITLDQTQPEILAIHDLGNGKIGIETRDEVSGVKIVNAVNKQTFNDHPLHVIAPISVTQNDSLTITVQDWAGNEVTETLPTHPAMTHTGYQSFYPNVSETIAGENVGINLYSGNGIVSFEGFTQPGIGLDVSTDITYNHQNRQKGLLEYGFTFDFEHKITPWTNGDATYISGDGTKYLFKKNGSGYTTYVGGQEQYYPQLAKTETQIILTWEDLSTFTFSKDGRILEQKDRYGNKNTFTYEELNKYHKRKEYRLDYITGSTNKKIDLVYNTETGKLDKIQGPGREEGLTREVSFEYQDNKLIYKDVMNASTTIAFDSMKRVESITKPNNVTTDWSYGSKNRLERVSMTRSQDNVEEFINVYYQDKQAIITNPISEYTLTWDMQGRPDSKKESVEVAGYNNTTKIETAYTYYTYDRNNLVKTVEPMGIATESIYDERDRLKATKSPSGSVMNYQYNDKNDLVLETGPYGYKIEYQYNYSGNKISNVKTIKHVQDPYGRTAPYQVTSQIYYQANGLVDYEIDGNKNNINYSYDNNGFLTNDGFDTTYTNDLVGNVKTKTVYAGTADANTTTFEYNDRNQQVKVIYPELIQVNENGSRYSQRLIQEDNYNQLSGLLESTEQYDQFNPSKRISAEYLYDDGNNNIRVTTDNIVTKSIVDGVGNTTKTITYPLDAPNEQLVTEYLYNRNGLLEKTINPSGQVDEYLYNKAGDKVKGITTVDLPADYNSLAIVPTDIEPVITTYDYYPSTGLLKSVVQSNGGKTEYIYDLNGRDVISKEYRYVIPSDDIPFSIKENEPDILVSAARYNSMGQIIEELSPAGAWTRYQFDGNGNINKKIFGGPIPNWGTDELLQGERDTIYSGHEIISTQSYEYDAQGRVFKKIDGEGYLTEYKYEGLTEKIIEPAYDENHQLITVTSSYVYDPMGNLVKEVTPMGYADISTYDVFGNILLEINPEGKKVKYYYDSKNYLDHTVNEVAINEVTHAKETQTINFEYDKWGNRTKTIKQLEGNKKSITEYQYSKIGDLVKEINPDGEITNYQYNSFGQVVKEKTENITPDGVQTIVYEYKYNSNGHKYKTIWPNDAVSYSISDTAGNPVIEIDQIGNVSQFQYTEDNLIRSFEQYGKTNSINSSPITKTTFVYDGIGNSRLIQDPNGYLIEYVYDKEGREIEERFEESELGGLVITDKKEYDPRGLVIANIDGEGYSFKTYYDANSRIVKEEDPKGIWTKYEYNDAGFLMAVRTPLGRDTEMDYNLRGQKTYEVDALDYQYKFDYNVAGLLTGETNKQGDYIKYNYSNGGNITSKYTPSEGLYKYGYDSSGNMVSITEPLYGTTYYQYNELGLLKKVNEPGDFNRRLITSYTYYDNGNLKSLTDPNGQKVEYTYDYSNRLATETMYLGGVQYTFEYLYDGLGNLIYEKSPSGQWTVYNYDFKGRLSLKKYSDGNYTSYTYYKNDKVKTETSLAGTTSYTYYPNGQVKNISYPSGDFIEYKYDSNGALEHEIINGQTKTYNRNDKGLTSTFEDHKGFVYKYTYTPDGLIYTIELPNGVITDYDYKPGLLPYEITTKDSNSNKIYYNKYEHNIRDFVEVVNENSRNYGYIYEPRGQLEKVITPEGDIRLYSYDDAGNRKTRSAIIGGKEYDRHETIEIDVLVEMVLEKMSEDEAKEEKKEKEDKSKGNDNNPGKKDRVKSESSNTPVVYSATKDKEDKNNSSNKGNDNGNKDKNNDNDSKNSNNGKGNDKSDVKGNENAVNRGNGKKIGLLKKLGIYEDEKKTGQVENILAVVDQIVNGEVNLPSGEHEELFALVREVGKGYTVIGTTWDYNEKNEITHRENHIRFEEYDYAHDDEGNMTSNERSQYIWNAQGLLDTVIFPDGSGQKYQYDARGRRTKTIQFNHQENTQWEINYHYKGDSWNIDRETDEDGNTIKEFTYDEKGYPLSITFKGETFWYVYNGHGDVVALTDINGEVAARYEYDEWGLPTKMYNRYGERVREGTGWIGDLNTGNGTPGSKNEETDKDEIDQHPGNGNTKNADKKANNKNTSAEEIVATDENAGIIEENVEELSQETTTEGISAEEVTTEVLADEVTADITTDLVKENPYRYSGYYFDRKTQFYYLQARYYDPRIGRFISMDPLRGDMTNPLSLNRYVYGLNNPINYIDPTGHMAIRQVDNFFKGFIEGLDLIINISAKELLETVNAALDTGKMLLNGTITGKDLVVSIGQSIVRPFTNLYNNFNLVMRDKPRDPKDYEVYKYGESTGEVITIAAGLAAGGVGFKAIVKKLKDSLTNIYNKKKITSGNNKTHVNSNQGYSGDSDGKGNNNSKIFWGSWSDYKKVTVNGQTYAQVGNRLYSKHAVDRMQPSGNRYGSQITQAGGDYGRSVSPTYVENVIRSTKPVVQQNGNLSYKSGTLQVITNKQGAVVTIITR